MNSDALAALHRQCFILPPPWSARDFAGFLADPQTLLLHSCEGGTPLAFALFRIIGDEAELLTLATCPAQRRNGLARDLMLDGLALIRTRGAQFCYLEVAADNGAAIALYSGLGFVQIGKRRGYYHAPGYVPRDALVFRAEL